MTEQIVKIPFDPKEVDDKCLELENKGYEEYLNVYEKWTAFDDQDMTHVVYRRLDKEGALTCDIYFNDSEAFLYHS